MPQVSIITPAYNAERFLPRTLDSVRAQTLTDWELVLVDNGSTDGTARVAEAYAARDGRIRLVRQVPNVGGAGARNLGLAASVPSAPYVISLDADDLWEPDTLATLRDALAARPAAVAAHGLARYIDSRDRPFGDLPRELRRRQGVVGERLVEWPLDAPTTFAVSAYYNPVRTLGQELFRGAALTTVGPFDATLVAEDWHMLVRVSRLGEIAFVDRVVLAYRRHPAQM